MHIVTVEDDDLRKDFAGTETSNIRPLRRCE